MEILLTGDILSLTSDFTKRIAKNHKVIAAHKDVGETIGKGINTFQLSPHDENFEKLFHSYSFDYVLFFSQHPSETAAYYDELQDLECCFSCCDKFDVKRFLYISSTSVFAGQDFADENSKPVAVNGACFIVQTCEQLCNIYRDTRGFQVQILRIPSLYSPGESESFLGKAIRDAIDQGTASFGALPDQSCDFLSQSDFGVLVERILDTPNDDIEAMNVNGGSALTFGEVAQLLKANFPTLRVTFSKNPAIIAGRVGSKLPREEYGWVPVGTVEEDLPVLIGKVTANEKRKKGGFWRRMGNAIKERKFLLKLTELVVGFLLMELLNYYTRTTIQFQYIDFRLLYVVLMSIIHGMKTGLAASGFAIFSLIVGHVMQGTDWQVLLYNIDGWLPFVLYIVLATVVGYTKDKMTADYQAVRAEKDALEEKYVLLNEFYAGAIRNKGLYRNQIMSYKDSFGRIFEVAKRFDTILPEELFNEALSVLEEILDNQSICIYGFYSSSNFGRLIVCSQKILQNTPKSMNLEELSFLKNQLKENEVWVNSSRLRHYPEYAVPIYNDGVLVAMILVQKARYEQLSVYYENMIKVLCGMMQIAMVRALEYDKAVHDQIYWEDTEVMRPEYFKSYLNAQLKKAESYTGEYTLLKIDIVDGDLVSTANLLRKSIRENDVLGTDFEGGFYICLSQMNQKNLQIVIERLREHGLAFDTIHGGTVQ